MYDVGIIGAGPAGATLARLLADRCKVILLSSGRRKSCGGILNEDSQTILKEMGLDLPKNVIVDPQPNAVIVMDWDNNIFRRYTRNYINVNRSAFDDWLLSLVPSAVIVCRNAVYTHSEPNKNEFILHFREDGQQKSVKVRQIIGADGAFSAVRREFFPQPFLQKRYIAVQHWFDQNSVTVNQGKQTIDFRNNYTGIFDSSLTDYYIWTIPKNGELILGGAFSPKTRFSATMDAVKEKLRSFGLVLGTPFLREAAQMILPLGNWFHSPSFCFGNKRIIFVGEAAGLISPSSAEGISSALRSALFLSESFLPSGFDPNQYRRLLGSLLLSLRLKQFKIPLMFSPTWRKWVMLPRLTT